MKDEMEIIKMRRAREEVSAIKGNEEIKKKNLNATCVQ